MYYESDAGNKAYLLKLDLWTLDWCCL